MKKTLGVLLCLLMGCKELDFTKEDTPSPTECPLMATLPIHTIYLKSLPKGFHYEILVNNELLWNSCSHESRWSIIKATTSHQKEDVSMNIQIYENIFQENTLADVKIYKTDENCVADTATKFHQTAKPIFDTIRYDLPPGCGEFSNTSVSLSVKCDNFY